MTWCDLWVWALERITVPCHFSRSRVQSYFPFIVQPQTPQEKWGATWQLADYVHGEAGERVKKWAIMLGNINRSSCITVQDKDRQYSMHANSALKAERVHDYCSTLCLCLQQKKKMLISVDRLWDIVFCPLYMVEFLNLMIGQKVCIIYCKTNNKRIWKFVIVMLHSHIQQFYGWTSPVTVLWRCQ